MDYTNETALAHYGVKGMKWGVRRNRVNKDYTAKQRKRDRAFYGQGGERRINRRLNDGHSLQGARHYEAERKERREKRQKQLKKGAKKVTTALATVGTYYVYDQVFFGGAGTRAVKDVIKTVGMTAITAYHKARGGYDIHWYDKNGRKIV